jgi:hypothetical protein
MAYEDWDTEFREVWEELPGVPLFRDYEYDISEQLFEDAFTHHSWEPGYDADAVKAAREEFFEFTGLPEEMFPWDDWREAMGYD